MIPVADELRDFHGFVTEKLEHGGVGLSPEEALDQWRADHPDPEDLAESVAAVRQALSDMAAGDVGRPADEVIAELRIRHQLPRQ